ncbi:hypothetical protein GCM10027348_12840 [Hymenobacter tenuis]
MLFNSLKLSVNYFQTIRRNAVLTCFFYGPFVFILSTIATWAKVGDSPNARYFYIFNFILVGWGYYYTGVIRAGIHINRYVKNAEVNEATVWLETYSWLYLQPKSVCVQISEIDIAENTILNVELYKIVTRGMTFYIKKGSLQNESELISLLKGG